MCFSSCLVILSFVCQYSLRYYWYYYNKKQSSGAFLQKSVLVNFAKITRKHQKGILVHIFSCEFCKISHNNFFKEPFGRLLLHKQSLCLLSYHNLLSFQKQCGTYFLDEYFFGLICRLGTKVCSIFKALSQKPTFNPVKHLG